MGHNSVWLTALFVRFAGPGARRRRRWTIVFVYAFYFVKVRSPQPTAAASITRWRCPVSLRLLTLRGLRPVEGTDSNVAQRTLTANFPANMYSQPWLQRGGPSSLGSARLALSRESKRCNLQEPCRGYVDSKVCQLQNSDSDLRGQWRRARSLTYCR